MRNNLITSADNPHLGLPPPNPVKLAWEKLGLAGSISA
jgi:hypothetical protein